MISITYNDSNIIPYNIEEWIVKKYGTYFRALEEKEIKDIKKKYKTMTERKKLKTVLIGSLHVAHLREKNIRNFQKKRKKFAKIVKYYKNKKKTVEDLSSRYGLSPLTIMRIIFPKKIKMKYLKNNKGGFDAYDYKQIKIAHKIDIVSPLDQTDTMKRSQGYENMIERNLKSLKVSYYTETKQRLLNGTKSKPTPDFLLETPVSFNGIFIHWIEVKNFYGANTRFIKKKIAQQVGRYSKLWGKGLLVFNHGYSEKLQFEDTIIISFTKKNTFQS